MNRHGVARRWGIGWIVLLGIAMRAPCAAAPFSDPIIIMAELTKWLESHSEAITNDQRDILSGLVSEYLVAYDRAFATYEDDRAAAPSTIARQKMIEAWMRDRFEREQELIRDARAIFEADSPMARALDRFWYRQRRLRYFHEATLVSAAKIAIDVPGFAEEVGGADTAAVQARLREYDEQMDAAIEQAVRERTALMVDIVEATVNQDQPRIDEVRRKADAVMLRVVDTHRALTDAIAAAFAPPHGDEFMRLVNFEFEPGLKNSTPCDVAFARLREFLGSRHETIRSVVEELEVRYVQLRAAFDEELAQLAGRRDLTAVQKERTARLWEQREALELSTTRALRTLLASISEPIPPDITLLLSWDLVE